MSNPEEKPFIPPSPMGFGDIENRGGGASVDDDKFDAGHPLPSVSILSSS